MKARELAAHAQVNWRNIAIVLNTLGGIFMEQHENE
jgi:hypothetical protein